MSIIYQGSRQEVPGLKTVSWQDGDGRVREATHTSPRSQWLRHIIAHTHIGSQGTIRPGKGSDLTAAFANAKYQVDTTREVSWDFTVCPDGEVLCQNDVSKKFTWQATNVNPISFGFEMIQETNGDLYEDQVAAAVTFVDFMTAKLGIQRQIHWDTRNNKPSLGLVKRLLPHTSADGVSGVNCVGVFGHCQQTSNRGPGDPGHWIFLALRNAGYECFDFNSKEDLVTWQTRQKALGFNDHDADGVPGSKTRAALVSSGKKSGMWVSRPIDTALGLV